MRISSLLLFSALFIQPIMSYADISTHQLTREDGSDIHYYIDKRSENNKTLLVLLQGSDCNSVKNNTFIQETFGQWLPDSDILMVEKYGITAQLPYLKNYDERKDCPLEYMLKDNPTQRTNDYSAVLDKLSPYYPNLVLVGGSEGAIMVHLIIDRRNDIKAGIALNGGGRFFIDDVIYNIRHTTPSEYVKEATEGFQQFAISAKNNELDNDQIISEHGKLWWHQFLSIDLQAVMQKNNHTPVLIVQTLNDINVDVDAFDQLSRHIQQSNIQFMSYKQLDHGFYGKDGLRHTDEIINMMKQWYAKQ